MEEVFGLSKGRKVPFPEKEGLVELIKWTRRNHNGNSNTQSNRRSQQKLNKDSVVGLGGKIHGGHQGKEVVR